MIRVGTCAWADHEAFYPKGLKPAERLAYYARYFSLVEIDATYYALMPQRNFAAWAQRTPDDFRFNIKAYRAMTRHDRVPRPGEEDLVEVFRRFAYSIEPIRPKLKALHFQFPPWFTYSSENLEYLYFCREFFADDLVAIEFRHKSWFGPGTDTLYHLRRMRAVHVLVDTPAGVMPKVVEVTDPRLSVIRFHGRNQETWYKRTETTQERFDYLYAREELAEWVPTIQTLAKEAAEVHALMNNNQLNYAVKGAIDLLDLLGLPLVDPTVPRPMTQATFF